MLLAVFMLGFLCGLAVLGVRSLWKYGLPLPLSEEEKYLLEAARAGGGRLILKKDAGLGGTPLLLLKEFPNPRRLEDNGLIERMVKRRFIQPDGSGVAGRYLLTSIGWLRSQRLPDFPLQPIHQGPWFNSISRKPMRRPHH